MTLRFVSIIGFAALCACGGGGGSNGGGGNTPPPEDPSPGVLEITSENAVEITTSALTLSNLSSFIADELAGVVALLELNGLEEVESKCDGPAGVATTSLSDTDGNGAISAGDRVFVDLVDCVSIDGTLTLTIADYAKSGDLPDRIRGHADVDLTLNLSPIPIAGTASLRGSQTIDLAADITGIRWTTSAVVLTFEYGEAAVTIRGASTDFSITNVDALYTLGVEGTIETEQGDASYRTTTAIHGLIGRWPFEGEIEIEGDSSRALFAANDDPLHDQERTVIGIDGDGDGQLDEELEGSWIDLLSGSLLGLAVEPGARWPISATPIPDLTSRLYPIGGEIVDVARDAARGRLYFSLIDRNEIAIVDMATLEVVERVYVGSAPRGIAMSADGATLYAALHGAGAVAALDLDTLDLEQILISVETETPYIYDVAEIEPGIVYAMGERIGGFSHLVRIDRNAGDLVTRVGPAAVPEKPQFLVDPNGDFLYVWGEDFQGFIAKMELATGSVVLVSEDSIRYRAVTMKISPDGSRIYTSGWFPDALASAVSTSDLAAFAEFDYGVTEPLSNGQELLSSRLSTLKLLATDTFELIDQWTYDCREFTAPIDIVPLAEDGEWLLVGQEHICSVDIYDSRNPPGGAATSPLPDPVETISMSVRQTEIAAAGHDLELDPFRNRWIVSIPAMHAVEIYDADTLELVARVPVGGPPLGIDLAPAGAELAVAFADSAEVGFLHIDTETLQTFDLAEVLGASAGRDVAWWQDMVFVIGDGALGDIAVVDRAAPEDADALGNSSVSGHAPELLVDSQAPALFVGKSTTFEPLVRVDLSDPSMPLSLPPTRGIADPHRLSLDAEGRLLALGSGQLVRSADLTLAGEVEGGVPAFSSDGRSLLVAVGGGEIRVYDVATLLERRVLATDCDIVEPTRLVENPSAQAWALMGEYTLCSIDLAATASAAPALSTKPSASKLHTCEDDCLVRKYVLPDARRPGQRLSDLASRLR